MTWIELIYSLPFILMGGCIFSFADVVADRLPRKISFVKGRSYCPSCGHTLAWYDMIPVVSWLLLRGKCRQCRCRIPARYPVTEAMGMATAEISLLCFGGWNGYWHEINLCVVTVFSLLTLLLIIAQIDQQTMEIPNCLHSASVDGCICISRCHINRTADWIFFSQSATICDNACCAWSIWRRRY